MYSYWIGSLLFYCMDRSLINLWNGIRPCNTTVCDIMTLLPLWLISKATGARNKFDIHLTSQIDMCSDAVTAGAAVDSAKLIQMIQTRYTVHNLYHIVRKFWQTDSAPTATVPDISHSYNTCAGGTCWSFCRTRWIDWRFVHTWGCVEIRVLLKENCRLFSPIKTFGKGCCGCKGSVWSNGREYTAQRSTWFDAHRNYSAVVCSKHRSKRCAWDKL